MIRSYFILFFACYGLGCANDSSALKKDYLSQGAFTARLPVYQNGDYKFADVTIETLSNLSQVSGSAAQFFASPGQQNNQLIGAKPSARFLKDQMGRLIPMDTHSTELFTLYYHFEQLMKLDKSLGSYELLTWPRQVGIETRVADQFGEISENNARYSAKADAYLFEKYTKNHLPLNVNASVIAHEHFHAIFAAIFKTQFETQLFDAHFKEQMDAREEEAKNQDNLAGLTRAWNEALADVWAWIYGGDTQFFARSLPLIETAKMRDFTTQTWTMPSESDFKNYTTLYIDTNKRLGYHYQVGALLARIIVQQTSLVDKSQAITRHDLGKSILKMLPELAKITKTEKNISPSLPLLLLSQQPALKNQCKGFLKLVPDADLKAAYQCPE